jgi:hypothetical protein
MERDGLISCWVMMIELWTRKRQMVDEDENDVEDTRECEKSGVLLAWLGLEELVAVVIQARLSLVPAILGMVNWLTCEILSSPSFSSWFPPSPLIPLYLVVDS